MQTYFGNFPSVKYSNVVAVDISRREVVQDKVFRDSRSFYPYVIKSGERPDQVASRYYGDPGFTWLVYLSIGAVDPHYSWPLDDSTFQSFLEAKYGSVENAQRSVTGWRLDWAGNAEEEISQSGYDSLPEALRKYYAAVYGPGNRVQSWKRRRVEWEVSTNMVVTWHCDGSDFQQGETVSLMDGPDEVANAVVAFANSSVVTGIHVSGNAAVGNTTLVGDTSNSSVAVGDFDFVSNAIPIDERPYWSTVSAYDREVEANEKRKFVNLIDAKYAYQIANQLKKDLKT
jgi:hypothetical protein